MYAYTYEGAMRKFSEQGLMLIKVGDSHRDTIIRINEQGGAAEYEGKIVVGGWNNLRKIDRDHRVHEVLRRRGLFWREGKGKEWFRIPAANIDEARSYIDDIITLLEGRRVRRKVQLRISQQRALDQALDYIASAENEASLIAHLCPRFGKTIWALMLFNRITEIWGNRVMLLPAYWLSVHSSFVNELNEFDDFLDIRCVDTDQADADAIAKEYLKQNLRIVVPISLHGELSEWKKKHQWIRDISNDDIFSFADEGDFGTHTANQTAKLNYIFSE